MPNKIVIIGGGLSGLSAACCLAKAGMKVTVLEKNEQLGGRARQFTANGFTFDMGPSWYWMPDVFEDYYNEFGFSTSDFYELKRLDPSYRVFFGKNDYMDQPASLDELYKAFEAREPGSSKRLEQFLKEAQYKYEISMKRFVYKPGRSLLEFVYPGLLFDLARLNLFKSISSYIRKYFKDPQLIHILEFPILFLGAKPTETPALYSLMNYADMKLGTWYPMGGMVQIVNALEKVALHYGAEIKKGEEVEQIRVTNRVGKGVISNGKEHEADIIIGSADYHHVEQKLLSEENRTYSMKYWNSRDFAPSCLIFYLGINKKVSNLLHHCLLFDTDFSIHQREIYDDPVWPSDPLFYVSCTSKTDPATAPEGGESIFILIPVAVGLKDTEETRKKYLEMVINRLEHLTGEGIREHIVYERSYSHSDFSRDYNAFRGNALGLANTLGQTAVMRPSVQSKKVKNLFYTGQFTVPGPGVPPCIISGQLVSREILKMLKVNS